MAANGEELRILIAGGGTGGHLFPGIAIAEAFRNLRICDIRFVGTRSGIELRAVPKSGYRLYTIPVSGLYRVGFFRKLKSLLKLPLAFIQSLWIVLTFHPHLVVGIGGYASGPVLALAILLRQKTVLQEQNAYPGMTNRLLGKFVPLAFVPFDGVNHLFRQSIVVGNPIRKEIIAAAKQQDERGTEKSVITILGGSQGARILNQTMIDALPLLTTQAHRLRLIHQTGSADYSRVQSAYDQHPTIEATISPFFDEIAKIYLQSHLLICRAGSIVNEIIAIGRASILVPISVSSGNHQNENANKMVTAGAAIKIDEKELNGEILFQIIQSLLDNHEKRRTMESNAKALFPGDSAEKIVTHTIEYYKL
ncbi:MAG: undecaprenyldiphospho-muramoylpentapeptide beta-N-acetylglucosaminyltransferase [SAR324 cluster bacterium]|nr:undecaprenyldiphospho-muramoylpentapeptide beta-N-acetylglucosaminyltransferase [SAR324 cluster bacterium]